MELSPLSVAMFFPFGSKGDKMYGCKEFQDCSKECLSTLDFVVTSIGPDMDILFTHLMDIATSCECFGKLRPEHWTVIGQVLISSLEDTLGSRFDETARDSWTQVYESIS